MEHFSEQAWADFVRGISNSEREEMKTHLAGGCNDCAKDRDVWRQVHAIAVREGNYAPPAPAVRMAKSEFLAQSLEKDNQPILATLSFDTFGKPALAGIRSAAASARQMVYEADGLTIDLRFDGQASSKQIVLTGQVLDKQVPRTSLEGTGVILWTDRGLPLAETEANAFGEFSLEVEPKNNLRLSVQVMGRGTIRIPLANLAPEHNLDFTAEGSDVGN
jgi:hypothetical protein